MPKFNLRIVFTGICTFVPNSEDGRTKMCVVLPDGRGDKNPSYVGDALDKSKLKRHVGYVLFNLHDVKAAKWAFEDAAVLWYLSGQRLTLQTEGSENPFDGSDLRFIAKLEEVVPGYGVIASDYLAENPNAQAPGRVLAHFLINAGKLTTGNSDQCAFWVLPNTISKKDVKETPLAHEVKLEFTGLTSASLAATAFDGETTKTWHFEGEEGKWVEIVVANLCDDNPLRWKSGQDPISPDQDFKWHYRLLDKGHDLSKALNGLELPMPYYYGINDEHNGQGVNCPPGQAAKSPLNGLDPFLG